MDKSKIITELIRKKNIFETMYGSLLSDSFEDIIKIFTKELYYIGNWKSKGPSIFYIWGQPGIDSATYPFSDYGKIWSLQTERKAENAEI